jgi:serine/threonine-protein kinase
MAISTGTRLGPYEVTGVVGAGGMGEVYRARDTRLGRSVALKILPASFSTDPDRLARFEREARTLASLNHPHIAHVYGFEEGPPTPDATSGVHALIMELVPGESLAQRIRRGPIPVAEAMEIARQIADGLATAHARGIIHRDLKPANVQITPEGTVKILDFGLAKAVAASDGDASEEAHAATITSPAQVTQAGIVLGTAAYMSPEQAKGLAVDRRTDVWALGCVLFEMLTARRLFDGPDVSEVLASVLRAEVDWTLLPSSLPPVPRAFLMRSLQRDPRQRLQDIGDMRLALEGAFDVAVSDAQARGAGHGLGRRMLPIGVAALLAAATAGGSVWSLARTTAPPPAVARMRLTLPADNDFYFNGRHLVAVSPTGRHVAYSAGLGLWIHSLDELEARPVPGAENEGRSPFFSPDGQWLGYYSSGELRRAPITGGTPVRIATAVNPWGASWGHDGQVYYGQGPEGIWRVPSAGGTPERVVPVGAGEQAHRPQLLPDGEWVLFTLLPAGVGSWNRANIVIESLKTHQRIALVEGGRDARYLTSGHLIYAVNGALLAAPLDLAARKVIAGGVRVVENVFDAGTITGAAHFDVNASGALVYVPRIGNALRLTWVDRRGNEEAVPGELRPYRHPRVSPDGTRIAVEVEDPANTDVWVGDARRGTFARLTTNEDVDSDPIWTPDGTRVVFSSVRGKTGLFWQPADGSGGASHIADGTGGVRPLTWTGSGELVYEELAGPAVDVLPLDGRSAGRPVVLFDMPEYFNEKLPAISPDGRWVAYQSTESGGMEIYVRPFPNVSAGRWQISTGGGFAPLWSHNGQEIYYRNDRSLMAVAVRTTPTFAPAAPQMVFRLADYVLAGTRGIRYDVAPDGRFLLMKDEDGRETRDRIVVVQNWFEELRRLVPSP